MENARYETERQFLAILALHNEMFEISQVQPHYLSVKEHCELLDLMEKSYINNGSIVPKDLLANQKCFDLLVELYSTELITSSYKKLFFALQNNIFNFYKEDIISKLSRDLERKSITYQQFIEKIEKLNSIKPVEETERLTKNTLLSAIASDKREIPIKNFPKLNDTLQLVQGDFLIIGATTGVGKSGLMLNLMNSLIDDYQCVYFNMEMSVSTIYKRIVSIRSNVPISYLKNPTPYQKELIEKACNEIENNKVYVEHKATDISSIKSVIQKVKSKDKHTIIFLDHLGLIKCPKNSLYEQATEISKQLRQICLEYDCTIIGASQLNRSAYSSEEITLSMLKDSGELENSASKVILLYRDKKETKDNPVINMFLEIAKNRDGQLGIIRATYDKTKQVFKERRDY